MRDLSIFLNYLQGFPGGSPVNNLPAMQETTYNAGDTGSIPGLGRSPGEGSDNPFQYSCLENPMEGRAGWATVQRVVRGGHDVATKPPPPEFPLSISYSSWHVNSSPPWSGLFISVLLLSLSFDMILRGVFLHSFSDILLLV